MNKTNDILKIRNYFGKHDKTPFEHWAYTFLDKLAQESNLVENRVSQTLDSFTHLDLFSGIGGFALAAKSIWKEHYENVGFCEIDKFCQKVLRKNFGNNIKIFEDIRNLREGDIDGQIDLITGGFPCQPFSEAGRRKGVEDKRSLFPEMLRVISDFKPRWIVGENVYGLFNWNTGKYYDEILTQLEIEGYETETFIIPASSVNAPHKRNRVWLVAHAQIDCNRGKLRNSYEPQETQQRPKDKYENETQRFVSTSWDENWEAVAARLCGVDDGIPDRMDRFRALGNAIVPQIAMVLLAALKATDDKTRNEKRRTG